MSDILHNIAIFILAVCAFCLIPRRWYAKIEYLDVFVFLGILGLNMFIASALFNVSWVLHPTRSFTPEQTSVFGIVLLVPACLVGFILKSRAKR